MSQIQILQLHFKLKTLLIFSLSIGIVACSDHSSETLVTEEQKAITLPEIIELKNNDNSKIQLGAYKEYKGDLKSLSAVNIRNAKIEVITNNLTRPWAFEFIDDTKIIITEIKGNIKILDLNSNSITSISGVPKIPSNDLQIGLYDIELHPDFYNNHVIYFSHAISDPKSNKYYSLAVSKATLINNEIDKHQVIFDANPFTWSPSNFGGALEFDNKGRLYVAIGDRSESETSQNLNILQGKILRLNDQGQAAKDNPYINTPNVDNRLYSIGVRNPQGLHFDSVTEQLFEAEHGPMGGDEVNIIKAGANYGWPINTYGMSYLAEPIGEDTHSKETEQPLFYYLPSEAISPLTIYRGKMFSEWDGDILVGALKGKHISKLDLDGNKIRSEFPILEEINGRIRDIKVANDGSIYILSQNGSLYRLSRDLNEPEPIAGDPTGKDIYKLVCAGCHDSGAYQAPILGNTEHWEKVLTQTIEQIYQNTFQGLNDMPARGYCNICTDQKLKITVDYMLNELKD